MRLFFCLILFYFSCLNDVKTLERNIVAEHTEALGDLYERFDAMNNYLNEQYPEYLRNKISNNYNVSNNYNIVNNYLYDFYINNNVKIFCYVFDPVIYNYIIKYLKNEQITNGAYELFLRQKIEELIKIIRRMYWLNKSKL